jgi:hypothetical protein
VEQKKKPTSADDMHILVQPSSEQNPINFLYAEAPLLNADLGRNPMDLHLSLPNDSLSAHLSITRLLLLHACLRETDGSQQKAVCTTDGSQQKAVTQTAANRRL